MNKEFMLKALKMSNKALNKGEVPVGAVIVKDNKIISKAYNNRENLNNVLGHAEIIVIQKAQEKIKDWRLNGCDMYVTLRPCQMCENIIKESRIVNVYYLVDKTYLKLNNNKTKINRCVNFDEQLTKTYQQVLTDFFKNKR